MFGGYIYYNYLCSMNLDDLKDLAVLITGDLVLKGLVMDCTDTDEEDEFLFQDAILETLCKKYKVENN
jgi:hypothetical protein